MNHQKLIDLNPSVKVGALCLGSFDGIHLGHKALIKEVLKLSDGKGACAVSFSPHPKEFFNRRDPLEHSPFERLATEEMNVSLMINEGLNSVYYVPFDAELAKKNYEEFLEYLKTYIDFSNLIVGFDFRFGKSRSSGLSDLKTWCLKNNIGFKVVDEVSHNNKKVSSSLIRSALKDKNFDRAEALLGHRYFLEGFQIKDQGLGKKIGFPTLNIKFPKNLVLENGVYGAVTQIENKDFFSIVNFGVRPTVKNRSDASYEHKTLEIHILDKQIEPTGSPIKVFFEKFLRPEKKFDSIQDLSLQIKSDIKSCRSFFSI